MRSPRSHSGPRPTTQPYADDSGDLSMPGAEDELGVDASGSLSSAAASAGGSNADTRGKSTGLETMLGKLFVERGYLTHDELESCRGAQERAASTSDPRELGDLLIESEYVTKRQLERVRREIEAEKSTQQIPGYKIMRRLGSGAMATVFLARQLSLDRLVAIKVLPQKFSSNEKFIERFYKEGQAAAQLNHRNIVAAYDVGKAGEHHYFVMEYVDGDTVYERIIKKKRFDEATAIKIIRETAAALQHAHEKGFVHRDVKPKNIMLTADDTVKLADLGLARAVSDKEAAEQEAGRAYGTPYYISPEQIRGVVDIDPRADIYGLGATFYHMVTGKVPFEGRNPSSVMHKHLKQKLVPPDHVNSRLSPGTAQVIEKMMAKSRKARYQAVDDLLTDIELIAKGEPPHFAESHADVSGIARIEDSIAAQPALMPEMPRPKVLPFDSPAFLGAIGLAVVSLLINLVLIAVIMAENNGAAPAGTPGGANPIQADSTVIGAWESTRLEGTTYAGVRTVQLAMFRNGDGSLVLWRSDGSTSVYPFSWDPQGNEIELDFAAQGKAQYGFQLSGDTLIMDRRGANTGRMTLQKQY